MKAGRAHAPTPQRQQAAALLMPSIRAASAFNNHCSCLRSCLAPAEPSSRPDLRAGSEAVTCRAPSPPPALSSLR